MIEHRKSKVFHFSRLHRIFNPPSLDLSPLEGFIFDKKLSFQQHINFSSNKALLIVKYMKMLENSTRELLPHQK